MCSLLVIATKIFQINCIFVEDIGLIKILFPSSFGLFGSTHVIVNEEGNIAATYRKLHMFDVDLGKVGGVDVSESDTISPGKSIAEPCFSPVGYLGLSVSYDLRFPELYRHLILKGAQILLIPSAFLSKTGASHWETLLRTRAIENQVYVIASAQINDKAAKSMVGFGHSMIGDPWGDIEA